MVVYVFADRARTLLAGRKGECSQLVRFGQYMLSGLGRTTSTYPDYLELFSGHPQLEDRHDIG